MSKELGVVVIIIEKFFENWEILKKNFKNCVILVW